MKIESTINSLVSPVGGLLIGTAFCFRAFIGLVLVPLSVDEDLSRAYSRLFTGHLSALLVAVSLYVLALVVVILLFCILRRRVAKEAIMHRGIVARWARAVTQTASVSGIAWVLLAFPVLVVGTRAYREAEPSAGSIATQQVLGSIANAILLGMFAIATVSLLVFVVASLNDKRARAPQPGGTRTS